jgi:ferric-dicitrate binding protein FerR (iron transport regulator)
MGAVDRDFAAELSAWKTAEVGARFDLGDGIQTSAGASALLTLDDGAQLSMQAETLIRFSDRPPQEHAVAFDVETGTASVVAADTPLLVQTRVGLARIESGTRVALSSSGAGLRFEVQVGRAIFGDSVELGEGQAVLVDAVGHLKPLEQPKPEAVLVATDPTPVAAVETAEPGDVRALVTGRAASIQTESGWVALPPGTAQLSPGTELKLERNTSVQLERDNQRAVLHENGRYIVAPPSGALVAAAAGSLSAGSAGAVRVEVPGGVIVVAPQGQASVKLQKKTARIEVQAREAVIESSGHREKVGAGQGASVAADGIVSVEGRSLDYADLEISTGESLIIHDPTPPTAVRFLFKEACPEVGTVQLLGPRQARQYAVGAGTVTLGIKPGSYTYELHCESGGPKSAKNGRLTVLKDKGTRGLAAHPPTTMLQADGRKYTVLYQNRLPGITLAWPSPPAEKQARLMHEFKGASETLEVAGPSHTFKSGQLEEGNHLFHFEAGGKVSRHTTVSIVFDNAAPMASLNTPVSMAAQPGDSVEISGTALPGWEVLIEGKSPARDAQGRFSLPVAVPGDRRALTVRLSHPERGTHIYLRRRQLP